MTSQQDRRLKSLEERADEREVSRLNTKQPSDRHFGRCLHWIISRDDYGKSNSPELAQTIRKILGLPKGCTLPGYNNAPKQAFYDEAARLIRLMRQQTEDEQHL